MKLLITLWNRLTVVSFIATLTFIAGISLTGAAQPIAFSYICDGLSWTDGIGCSNVGGGTPGRFFLTLDDSGTVRIVQQIMGVLPPSSTVRVWRSFQAPIAGAFTVTSIGQGGAYILGGNPAAPQVAIVNLATGQLANPGGACNPFGFCPQPNQPSIFSVPVSTIAFTAGGRALVSGANTIHQFWRNGNTPTSLYSAPFSPPGAPLGLAENPNGSLWLLTTAGVSRVTLILPNNPFGFPGGNTGSPAKTSITATHALTAVALPILDISAAPAPTFQSELTANNVYLMGAATCTPAIISDSLPAPPRGHFVILVGLPAAGSGAGVPLSPSICLP